MNSIFTFSMFTGTAGSRSVQVGSAIMSLVIFTAFATRYIHNTKSLSDGGVVSSDIVTAFQLDFSSKCHCHRCRNKQIFGSAKEFCPNFPKIA